MTLSDPRFVSLNHWLQQLLTPEFKIELISGDASFRRYFRLHLGNISYIAVDSPPDLVPLAPFIALGKALAHCDIHVPQVLASLPEQGFMLLQDLGDTTFAQALQPLHYQAQYQQALDLLPKIAQLTQDPLLALPVYDASFVQRELDIFSQWLVQVHLKQTLELETQQQLQACFQVLIDNALMQPQIGMHRDFHSRNLMWHQHRLYCIDFQDAVIGPVTYDAVSLLRDCYLKLTDDEVQQGLAYHYMLMRSHGLLESEITLEQYQRWFDLMGIQRHLKAAGIFCRLSHRDGKNGYLQDIPLTLDYILEISAKYPELAPLSQFISDKIRPHFLQTTSAEERS